jgi:hypothetical protein
MSPLADWDARLLTPARALELAGDWPVYADLELAELSQFEPEAGGKTLADRWQVNMRCRACRQSCGQLGAWGADGYVPAATSIGDLLSGVLRHMVMAHDQALSAGAAPVQPREVPHVE